MTLRELELAGRAAQPELDAGRYAARLLEPGNHVISNDADRIFEGEVFGWRYAEGDGAAALEVADHRRTELLLDARQRA